MHLWYACMFGKGAVHTPQLTPRSAAFGELSREEGTDLNPHCHNKQPINFHLSPYPNVCLSPEEDAEGTGGFSAC